MCIGLIIDFDINSLKKEYGDDYIKVYNDLDYRMKGFEGNKIIEGLYIFNGSSEPLREVYYLVEYIRSEKYKNHIRKLKIFRVEDLSDFTSEVRYDFVDPNVKE